MAIFKKDGTLKIIFAVIAIMMTLFSHANNQTIEKQSFDVDDEFRFTVMSNATILVQRKINNYKQDIFKNLFKFDFESLTTTGKNKDTQKLEKIDNLSYTQPGLYFQIKSIGNGLLLAHSNLFLFYIRISENKSPLTKTDRNINFEFQPYLKTDKYIDLEYEVVFKIDAANKYIYNGKSEYDPLKNQLLLFSSVDYINFPVKPDQVKWTTESFTFKAKEKQIMINLDLNFVKDMSKLYTIKSGKYEADIKSDGKIKFKRNEDNEYYNYPRKFNIRPLRFFNYDENNTVTMDNYFNIKKFDSEDIKPEDRITEESNFIKFNTTSWKIGDKSRINQNFIMYTKDHTVKSFTNQETLSNNTVFYNLGNGESTIYNGDLELNYDFVNYETPESSKKFELVFEIDSDTINKDSLNIYTFASLISQDQNSKILSVTINDKEEGLAEVNKGLYEIKIKTTPFKGDATIKFLFKFYDTRKIEVLKSNTPEHEKILFQNVGGVLLFTNPNWNIEDRTQFMANKYKSVRLIEIGEENKNKEKIREINTESLYYDLDPKSPKIPKAISVNFEGKSNVIFTGQNSIKNGTIIKHTYWDNDEKEQVEDVKLDEGEVYVGFNVRDWKRGDDAEKVYLQFYADELYHEHIKPEIKRLLQQKKEENKTEEIDLDIDYRILKGNYGEFTEEKMDLHEKFAETSLKFKYQKKLENMSGGFVLDYKVVKPPKPEPEEDSGNPILLIIILSLFGLLLIGGIAACIIRRDRLRKTSESANRLTDSQN